MTLKSKKNNWAIASFSLLMCVLVIFAGNFLIPSSLKTIHADNTTKTSFIKKKCPIDRPIVLGGLNWKSAEVNNQILKILIEATTECEIDIIPGTTETLTVGLGRGDVDLLSEIWVDIAADGWRKAYKKGLVDVISTNFDDATQGWYVPDYMVNEVNGKAPLAPGLKSVFDLKNYVELLRDREQPNKGRFYNCPIGWNCEGINTKKLSVYGLNDLFTNFRAGSGAALEAELLNLYKRRKPFVTYYWQPTPLMGRIHLVKLEEPPYNDAVWKSFRKRDNPTETTAFPSSKVVIAGNVAFIQQVPDIVALLKMHKMDIVKMNTLLAWMDENDKEPFDAAVHFYTTMYNAIGGDDLMHDTIIDYIKQNH